MISLSRQRAVIQSLRRAGMTWGQIAEGFDKPLAFILRIGTGYVQPSRRHRGRR